MKSQLTRLANGMLVYGLGSVLNRALSFILLPLFTYYLTPQDYGVSALVGLVTLALSGVFSLGTGNSMGICFFEKTDPVEQQHVIWTTAFTMLVNCFGWCALGFVLAPQISVFVFHAAGYEYIIRLSLISLGISMVATPFLSYLRLMERPRKYVAITVIQTIVTLGGNILFIVFWHRGINSLFEVGVIAQSITLALVLIIVASGLQFGIQFKMIPALIRIGFPSIFGLGAFYIVDYADRAMLQWLTNVETVGLYAIGYSFGLVMLLAVDSFASAWPPYFASFLNRRNEAEILFGKVLKYYLAIFGSLTLCFFALARPVVFLMTAPEFHTAYTVVGLVALAYMLKGCYLILLPGFYFEKKLIMQTFIEWMAALLTLALNLALIPIFHKEGAALATSLAYLSLPILSYLIGRKYLKVEYPWGQIGWWVAGFLTTAFVLTLLNGLNSLWLQFLLSLFTLSAYVLYVMWTGFSTSERGSVWQYLKMKMVKPTI